jgi:hypothetical protein
MPFDQQVLSLLGFKQPDDVAQPQARFDADVMGMMAANQKAMDRRKSYLRDKYAWGLSAPLSGTRETYSEKAIKEVIDPVEQEWLAEEVARISQAQAWAREKEYGEAGLAGRFWIRSQQVGGAFAEAGTAMTGAAHDFREWIQGRGRTIEEVKFRKALESAKQGADPSLGKDAPLSLKAAAGAAGMAPDLSAGLLAGTVSGPWGMFGYWTARLFPERNEDYLAQGLSPAASATAGAVTAAAESAIELLNIDPTGMSKGAVAQPVKGVVRRSVSDAIRKFGGKRLTALARRHPSIRIVIGQSLEALERTGVEITEEGIQRGVRDLGAYLAAQTDDDIDGPIFSDIAPAMWQEMKDAAPGIIALGGGTGAGMAIGEAAVAREEARLARVEAEIKEYAAEGKTPSRKTRKEWGLPEEGWESRQQRKEGVQRLAAEIEADERVYAHAREIVETSPEIAQEAGTMGREAGVPITPSVVETAGVAQGEVPAGKQEEARKWDDPVSDETSARIEAQKAAEEARPLPEGFLAEETGAKPIEGKLGERERQDVIGTGATVDLSTGDKENDRRMRKAHGITKPSFVEQFSDAIKTTWKYATRAQFHLPTTEENAVANEFFRLLKAAPPAAVDEAIRTVASVVDPLGPKQTELFESAIVAQNMMRTLEKNATLPEEERQSLRLGFTEQRARTWNEKIFAQVEATPKVKAALELRGKIVRETVVRLVEKGLLEEKALADPERYYHQQVLQMQEAKRQAGATGGARAKRRSFMMGRVTGVDLSAEKYDYNTSFIESETEWLADAFAELRKAELLEQLEARYDQTTVYKKFAEMKGITFEQAVHESDSVRFWQPVPGNAFYRAFTIAEKVGAELERGVIESAEINAEDVRQAVALGGRHRSLVLPKEIADQLDATEQVTQAHWLLETNKRAMDAWKGFILLNPKRIVGYNIRNFTGDMDPVLAADPRILKYMPQATTELVKYHHGRLRLSPEMRLARDLAVVSAGFFSAEVSETSELAIFRRLKPAEQRKLMRNPAKLYMEIVRPHVEMRENVLRYAAFLAYLDQIKSGELRHYGAAKRITVRTLAREMGPEVAAAHMSRELLGDYGNMTEAGEVIRRHLYPFWAFQEINIKRYPRLAINAIQSGQGRGRTAAVISTAAMMRIAGLYSAIWTWNNIIYPMIFGGDDEDQLSDYDSDNPHILLGRNPDGTIRNFRNVGALGDFLEWFGVNEVLSLMDEYAAGQADVGDVAWEMWKAPWEKLINLLRPDIKVGYELATGQSLFPDPFNPRSVRRDEAAAGALGYEDEYKWMKGLAVGRGTRARPNSWQRWFVGIADPRKAALGEMYDLRARFLKSKGKPEGGVFPVSEYKEARDAASNQDYAAFVEWKDAFQAKYPDSVDRFSRFLGRMDPIASRLSDRDEYEFEFQYLSPKQREKLQMSREYSADLRDLLVQWWVASEQEKPPGWEKSP